MNIDNTNIANGFYNAKPTCAGLTKSTNGHDQFAIEVAIEIEDQAEPVVMTLFSGLDTSKVITRRDGSTTTQLEITMEQAERCGIDTSLDIRQWAGSLDTERPIRVKVEADDYGPKLKGIYEPGGAGGLIKKQAMDDASAAAVASKLNAQIKALRAKRGAQVGGAKPSAPTPQRSPPRPANGARPAPQRQMADEHGDPIGGDPDDSIPFAPLDERAH
jgi:hypothetical protein